MGHKTPWYEQLTLTMASTVGSAELLKRTVKATRPDGSDDKDFPSGHTAVAFAAVRFMDKRYAQQVAPYTPWLYAAAGLTGLASIKADQPYWRDLADGAVLLCSLGAVSVGAWVLGPKLWVLF